MWQTLTSFKYVSDLAEVVSVTPASPAPGPPKKTDDKSFFDVSCKHLTPNTPPAIVTCDSIAVAIKQFILKWQTNKGTQNYISVTTICLLNFTIL